MMRRWSRPVVNAQIRNTKPRCHTASSAFRCEPRHAFRGNGPNIIWRSAMKLPRRTFLQFAGAAAFAPALSRVPTAQTYPSRPITMIVPFAPGGSDVYGRVLAERMKGALGQPVIIENVSGADGSVGTGRIARAKPDGYTIDL